MIDSKYITKGLAGMARSHQANTMAGHLGAAVLAGCFFGEDHPDLENSVFRSIESDLDKIIAGDESIWFNPEKAGVTIPQLFKPLPANPARESAIPNIAVTLSDDISELRQSGHDVIFAAIALRALHDHPESATQEVVAGIRKLLIGFHNAAQGRGNYGKTRGWLTGAKVQLSPESDFPAYRDEEEMAEIIIDELISSGGSIHRQGFGGLFHLINHAAALNDLSRMGYRGMARQGLAAHHRHLRLWRSLPDLTEDLGPLKKAANDPRTPAYWTENESGQWSAQLTHRIKTLHGFHSILPTIQDADKRKKAEASFLYLMG